MDPGDVCVLIPTLDEAETIGDVVRGFRDKGFDRILVIDGHSTDGTPEIARDAGATVVEQAGTGKGAAVREGLERIDRPFVLLVDGDGTYRPEDAHRLLDPLDGDVDHVIGNRFANLAPGAMSRLNQFGNWLINRVFTVVHGRYLSDILSGYRAFTTESATRLGLESTGFGIETEMSVECVRQNVSTTVVPIHYDPRPSGSATNLRPIRDGGVILFTLYRLAKMNNPLFYFGSLGTLSSLVGVIIGAYVGWDWLANGVSHEVLTVVGAFAILFGVQLLMFGVLSDLIVTLHQEQRRRIEALTDED
jgi:glycosyltransferase (TIGR04182 family)